MAPQRVGAVEACEGTADAIVTVQDGTHTRCSTMHNHSTAITNARDKHAQLTAKQYS